MGGRSAMRTRKLSTRNGLSIIRESQLDYDEDEAQRNVPKVDTGVEKSEEIVGFLSSPCP